MDVGKHVKTKVHPEPMKMPVIRPQRSAPIPATPIRTPEKVPVRR